MRKRTLLTGLGVVALLIVTAMIAAYVGNSGRYPFSFGLDLAGGTRVTYIADTTEAPESEIDGRMEALRRVIERRVNALGVSEPNIYTATGSVLTGMPESRRLVVELPGVTDIEKATRVIGETPYLEFKLLNREEERFESVGLQGGHVISAGTQFLPGIGGTLTSEPIVVVTFNGEGGKIFADITRRNVGEVIGIFLDGDLISSPVINQAIVGGVATIQGNFTLESATELADSLSFGALPLPIALSETRSVNPSLGAETIADSVAVGIVALLLIALLFVIVYRFVGAVAVIALGAYCLIVLTIFKIVPIVLTTAGLAGFIMSIGFAVDANVLIFERMREEIRRGEPRIEAIRSARARAWLAIRDANLTSMIIAFLLFWLGTSVVKGFAFAFGIGVMLSMLSAYVLTGALLRASAGVLKGKRGRWYIQ